VPAESLPATVAYSFIHLDAGGFNDAVTAFARELSSLSTPTPSPQSNARAWEVTAAVLGMDAIFIAWWYRKARRERELEVAIVGRGTEPMPEPLR